VPWENRYIYIVPDEDLVVAGVDDDQSQFYMR